MGAINLLTIGTLVLLAVTRLEGSTPEKCDDDEDEKGKSILRKSFEYYPRSYCGERRLP